MSAASDYQQAVRTLAKPLPAYVTYVEKMHAKVFAIVKDEDDTVTVRTSDGKVVKGKGLTISVDGNSVDKGSVLKNGPFKASCYEGLSTHAGTFDGRDAEAIALRSLCHRDKDQGDFTTLYVDPRTHDPLAAVGGSKDSTVYVNIEQRFGRTGEYVLPELLSVRVKGSGLMFWLDVDVHAGFSNYTFSEKLP